MGETSSDASFEHFVHEHSRSLFATARVLTGNAVEAEELLQDTLTHLYPRWGAVDAADSPVAYVRRSLANRFVSGRRSPASRTASAWELPERWDGRDLGETVATRSTIWQLLGTLPDKQRAAVVLRYLHDLPDSDTAAAIGCREVTVRSLVSRGLTADTGGSSGLAYRLQRAPVGTDSWTDIAPASSTFGAGLAVDGDRIVISTGVGPRDEHSTLYRSDDAGAHWAKVATNDTTLGVALAPDGAQAALVVDGSTCRVVDSDGGPLGKGVPGPDSGCGDNHRRWELVGMASDHAIVIAAVSEDASSARSLVERSTDGGAHWHTATF